MGGISTEIERVNMKLEVYCDGSGNTFDSDGGYGFRLILDESMVQEGSGYLDKATNNVAELTGAIQGLQAALTYIKSNSLQDVHVTLVSDSQLVLGYASGRYRCKALHLTQLYIQLRKVYNELGADGRWVKGHSGNEHNEACDKLAKTAREEKNTSTS